MATTNAFFNDTETSAGNLLLAGELDLKIDNESYYNGEVSEGTTWTLVDLTNQLFFNFDDLKPDDEGEDTISIHVQNDAYVCMDVTKTEDDDETCNEPELADDPTCSEEDADLDDGELGGLLNFMFWADDGDNVLEVGENVFKEGTAESLFNGGVWTLADSATNIWEGVGGPVPANVDVYVGKAWCLGTLTADPVAEGEGDSPIVDPGVNCDGTALDNAAQTDKFMADIRFTAVQARHNGGYLCNPGLTPTDTPTPTPIACVPGFATGVVASAQGTRKDGSAVLVDRTDPNDVLGAPQTTGTPSDAVVVPGSFFSLGFGPNNTPGGSIVLSFANPIVNQAGFDFRLFEVTGGTYPDEKIMVEASNNGVNFFQVTASATRDAFLDLTPSGLTYATQLRITDVSDKSLVGFPADADAYDLDGVQTFCGTQPFN